MKNKRIVIRIFSFLLMLTCLCGVAIGVEAAYNVDYSRPHDEAKETLSASELVSLVTGEELTSFESDYLALCGDFSLSYITTIGTGNVRTVYDKYEKTLSVVAYEYYYASSSDTRVLWKPKSVILHGEEHPLTQNGTGYSRSFSDVSESDDNTVSVIYSADFIIPMDVVNTLLNLTYDEAQKHKNNIAEKEREYTEALARYNEDKKNYEDYLLALSEFEAAKILYSEYLKAMREYNEEVDRLNSEYAVATKLYEENLAKYKAYVSSLAEYEADLEKYNAYLKELDAYNTEYAKYLNYLKEKETFADRLLAYESYLSKMETVREQILILDTIKTRSTSLKRDLYSAIMGTTVDSVLENRDVIANSATGLNPKIVDAAGDATENLRKHFREYFSLKTEAEKYNYYILNYKSIGKNFADLLRTLDRLYQSKQVCKVLIDQEKHEKYVILLAQLYYITNALNDTPVSYYDPVDDKYYNNNGVFDSKYRIWNILYNKKGTSPLEALEGVPLIEDKNSTTPLEAGYPTPIEEPKLTEVLEPTKPTVVREPVRPSAVLEPLKPTSPTLPPLPDTVEEPVEPEAVSEPGKEPVPYEPTELEIKFASAPITKREPLSDSYVFSPKISVKKSFVNYDEVTVVFYDDNGRKLYMTVIDKGTYAEYVGKIPERSETETEKYTFIGWTDTKGGQTPVSLSEINNDIQLYPCYKTVPKHKVTFRDLMDNVLYEKTVLDGSSVSFGGNIPIKPDTETEKYFFAGWTAEKGSEIPCDLNKITSSVTLYPIYKSVEKHKVIFLDFDGGALYETNVLNGEGVTYRGSLPNRPETAMASYTFVGWTAEKGSNIQADLTSVTSPLTLHPIFEEIAKYYDVTFNVDGVGHTVSLKYGDTPKYEGIPEREDTLSTYFVFAGWDKEIVSVKESVAYTATFTELYFVPYGDGEGATITDSNGILIADCQDSPKASLDIGALVDKASTHGALTLIMPDGVVIDMSYSEVLRAKKNALKYITFTQSVNDKGEYSYALTLLDEALQEITESLSLDVRAPVSLTDFEHLFLYAMSDSVWERVNFSLSDGYIIFNTGAAFEFTARLEYEISVITSEYGVEITLDRLIASPGDTVTVNVKIPEGIKIDRMYYVRQGGVRVEIEDGVFVMPADTVSVGIECSRIKYTVKFVLDDGTVYVKHDYEYGELPPTPVPPMKPDGIVDGVKYSYVFVRWSEEISPVSCDTVYTAIFDSEIVPEKDRSGLMISEGVLKLLVPAAALGLIFVVSALPAFIVSLVFTFSKSAKITRKKNKNTKK